MYNTPHHRGRNPILLTSPVATVAELTAAISQAVFGCERPAPRNLDGLADLLRESRITRVIACDWQLDPNATRRVVEVFRDNNVTLSR